MYASYHNTIATKFHPAPSANGFLFFFSQHEETAASPRGKRRFAVHRRDDDDLTVTNSRCRTTQKRCFSLNVHLHMGGFLKWCYPTTIGFPTQNDHFGVFWGYHYFWKHPYWARLYVLYRTLWWPCFWLEVRLCFEAFTFEVLEVRTGFQVKTCGVIVIRLFSNLNFSDFSTMIGLVFRTVLAANKNPIQKIRLSQRTMK